MPENQIKNVKKIQLKDSEIDTYARTSRQDKYSLMSHKDLLVNDGTCGSGVPQSPWV